MILTYDNIKNIPKKIYQDTDKCLEYFMNIDLEIDNNFYKNYNLNNPFYFHVYWYGKLDRKQLLCIKSYLATQNLEKTKLIIWLDYLNGYNDNNINLIPKHDNIIVKKYIPNELSKGTLFENKSFININDTKLVKYRSDLARIMFLYHYGGVYYDLDLILLKDLSPLLHLEFCYQWSNITNRGNNALLCIKKKSNYCIEIFQKYIKYVNNGNNFNISINSYIFDYNNKLIKLPCSIFDPVWILFDKKTRSKYSELTNFDNFFKKTDKTINNISDFFNGLIFCYHWHSRTKYNIEEHSYFEKIEKIINS
jgi:hypothetical protein